MPLSTKNGEWFSLIYTPLERGCSASGFNLKQENSKKQHREVEQLGARWPHTPKVAGSSPALATKYPFAYFLYLQQFYYLQTLYVLNIATL